MSLKKIAEMVGVSPSTVSRVLNHTSETCASKEIQNKIFAAAREINYQPNQSAKQLRSCAQPAASSHHISIILARITTLEADPFFSELFRSLEIDLLQQQTTIDHIIYAKDHLTKKQIQDLSASQGVIIVGRCSKTLLDHILSITQNVVGIWRNSMDFNVDEVVCDGQKAAELAMKHLIQLGHKNIAYIGDCSYESRYVGYCNSLIRNDIPMNYDWIKQSNQTAEEAEHAFLSLLEHSHDFTAVFCANDITAIRVRQLLKEKRRQIKRDISVISIDDIDESQNTKPYLTTIHIPRQEMAHMAITLLLDRIAQNHKEIVRIEFPCKIMNRSSCYPV